ncbi:MAG: sorbosone dehydrogenase family protein [Alphaproteobacteria bacterium]|nr:sorbosone dehydrogenase family protein [Alphaproteobacteria bacterium]MBU0804302.1 sorbosone dehydrogenase family protein [Alphaproteobacteria bacterium]MBU0871133.1 sorbosone dehydrogenase family protein [Alphaproteobacteria bacterium]MBU1400888.1 sorbosone dehydrogenase family protein [Alphaproteobacteria bacterium]MBU1592695.1 sorbosone dehydrogenase family protein [Alphaproteobacteria bacterium]
MFDRIRILRAGALAGSCLVLAALAGCSDDGNDFDISSQIGADPVLPEPAPALVADMKLAEVVGWKDGQAPSVPEGLTVSVYAKDLANPRTVYTLPNGDVLVVQSRGPSGGPVSRPKDVIRGWIMSMAHGGGGEQKKSNLITLLRDTDRDGTVDERSDLLTDLASPFGVAWYDGTLYVAATDAILAWPYELGQTSIEGEPKVLTPLPGGPINHHWTKDLVLSPDGRYLYASVGSNSNIVENGIEAEKGRAAIWQVDRETGASRVFASGLRNPNGLSFDPQTGELWAVINERDELGPNLVPDYMTSVKDGAFYGWPWSYYGDHVDERVKPARPDMVEKAIKPDYALSSHVAPLGMTFTADSALPEAYRDGAFVGEHGSWNRSFFNGYKVVYIPFENGMPAGKAQDVVTGFIDGDQARGRPVGVGIDGTGALLIADDAGNTVWRVAAADGSVTDRPIGTDRAATLAAAPSDAAPDEAGGADSTEEPAAAATEQGAAAPAETPAAAPEETPAAPLPGAAPEGEAPAQE